MFDGWHSKSGPRLTAWLAGLLAILITAHLWAHAASAPHPIAPKQATTTCDQAPPHDHHDEQAHGHALALPANNCPTFRVSILHPAAAPAVPGPAVATPPSHPPRPPPARGHRGRAIQNHTLEIFRP